MVEKVTNEFSSNDTFTCIVHYNKLRDNFFLDFSFSFLHFRFRRTDACQQQILIKKSRENASHMCICCNDFTNKLIPRLIFPSILL